MSRYMESVEDQVVEDLLDSRVANIEPPRQGRRINHPRNNKKQKAILAMLSGLVNKSLPILGRQGKIIQAVIDYYRDPNEEKLITILYNLVQGIPFETPSLEDTIHSITRVGNFFRVERYTDQMGGSKDKQKRRKKRTHKKGKRTQRK